MSGYVANLLGSVSLAIVDAVAEDAARVVGLGGQAAGALVLLDLRPRMSIKRLAERLSLTHPGAVRLVDRLEAAGLVARRHEGRTVRVELTEAGRGMVVELRRVRGERLDALVGQLSGDQRRALEGILEPLADALTTDLVRAYANCRLCDVPACEAHGCPVEAAARSRFGVPNEARPDETGR